MCSRYMCNAHILYMLYTYKHHTMYYMYGTIGHVGTQVWFEHKKKILIFIKLFVCILYILLHDYNICFDGSLYYTFSYKQL